MRKFCLEIIGFFIDLYKKVMLNLIVTAKPEGSGSDFLDLLIVAVILLFIFSTITEKVTELMRMYPSQFRIIGYVVCGITYFFTFKGWFCEPSISGLTITALLILTTVLALLIVANTEAASDEKNKIRKSLNNYLSLFNNIRKNNESPKEVKEKEISALSFTVGTVVAFLFNVSLFDLFNAPKQLGFKSVPLFVDKPSYGFNEEFFKFSLISLIGVVLTGFFLSFGAKFFHDILDTLLQIKNAKRKANEVADSDFNDIAEFDKFMSTQEKKLFEDFLAKTLNQSGVFFESDYDNGKVRVYVSNPAATVPERLFYKTALGKVKTIVVEKITSPAIRTLSTPLFASVEIANSVPFANTLKGTLCYYVKSKEKKRLFALTCYHVVWNDHDWDHFTPINREEVVHPFGGGSIGTIHDAKKNNTMDAALLLPKNITPVNFIEGVGEIKGDRALNEGDVNVLVKMKGSMSGNRQGYIAEMGKYAKITYPDGIERELYNLVSIKTNDGQPFSIGGDSGSLVVDEFGYALAMIVAGNEQGITLAIPFSEIKNQMNIEIYKA